MNLYFKDNYNNTSYIRTNLFSLEELKQNNFSSHEDILYKRGESVDYYINESNKSLEKVDSIKVNKIYEELTEEHDTTIYVLNTKYIYSITDSPLYNNGVRLYLKSNVTYYIRKRNLFTKKIEEFNELIYNKKYKPKFIQYFLPNYENKKEAYINKFVSDYIKYLSIQFGNLKLKQSYASELHKSVLIALKFDLNKPIILLDNIIEKIALFFYKAKNEKNIFIDNLINESIADFEKYLDEIITKMNSFKDDYSVVNEEKITEIERHKINEIKRNIFS